MTVWELICALQKMPMDARVEIAVGGFGGWVNGLSLYPEDIKHDHKAVVTLYVDDGGKEI